MIRPTLALVALVALVALAATTSVSFAQDAPKQEAPKQDAPAADAPRRFVTVKYVSGGTVRGVLEKGVLWERRDGADAWVAAKAGERGASLRLQYVNGADGSMVIPGERVKEVVVDGPFTDGDLAKTRDEIAAASAKAAEDRRLAAEKRAAEARAAAETAKAPPPAPATKPGETPPGPAPAPAAAPAADSPPVDTLDPATRRRRTELLAKYPPTKWTPETPAEIQKRFIVRHLPATKEEREFLSVFEEWKPAYEEWKKAQPVAPK